MAEQLYGIRKYLNDNGYSDDKIGYGNGNVTLNGRNFMSVTPQQQDDPTMGLYKDSTYAPQTSISSALSQYRTTDRNNTLNSTVDNMSNAVNAQPLQFKQTQQPFSYNKDNDQAYQTAIQSALQNGQTASNNAMVGLGARGIANSSIAVDRANQIQQREVGNVTRDVLPQLIQQAYQRYQDQNNNDYRNQAANYGVGQDQIRNQTALSSFLNGMNQQELTNANMAQDRAYADQDRNITRARGLQNDYGVGVTPTNDYSQALAQVAGLKPLVQQNQESGVQKALREQAQKQFETIGEATPEIAQILGIPVGTKTQQASYQNGQLSIQQQTASTAAAKANRPAAVKQPTATQVSKGFEGQVMNEVAYFHNQADTEGWLNANKSAITAEIGTAGFERVKKSALAQYQQEDKASKTSQKESSTIRNKAIALAQKDERRWNDKKVDRKALIKEYEDMLTQ